jgi:hypothetical protein
MYTKEFLLEKQKEYNHILDDVKEKVYSYLDMTFKRGKHFPDPIEGVSGDTCFYGDIFLKENSIEVDFRNHYHVFKKLQVPWIAYLDPDKAYQKFLDSQSSIAEMYDYED